MDIVGSLDPSLSRGYGPPDAKRAHSSKIAEFDCGDSLSIDDLLDFSNDDIGGQIEAACPPNSCTSVDAKLAACSWVDGKHSQASSLWEPNGPGDFCVPCDNLAELEWLSNFVEESFSPGDAFARGIDPSIRISRCEDEKTNREEKEQYESASPVSVLHSSTNLSGNVCISSTSTDISIPGRARSKRCRTPVCFWNTRIFSGDASASLLDSSSTSTTMEAGDRQSSDSDTLTYGHCGADSFSTKKPCKSSESKVKKGPDGVPTRKCLHCSIQRTPQWRAGPMGPKTLCNACGVRFKSGRLLPEYRPAASPTFMESIHSNSHRRVLEMRRAKGDGFTTKLKSGKG